MGRGHERRERRPGLKIGPVTFVFQVRGREGDPWAHRKGEPRVFALLWTAYLMSSCVLTVFGSRVVGLANEEHAYGVRAMLVMAVVGLCVVWPMVRLCQLPPQRPVRATLADLVVVLAPVQALVWPLPVVTRWKVEVAAGIVLMMASWALLVSVAVLAGGATRSVGDRVVWMAMCLVVVAAGPVGWVLWNGAAMPGWWGMLSPATAVFALTSTDPGVVVGMDEVEWWLSAAPGLAGLVGWAVVLMAGVGGTGRGAGRGAVC